MTLGNRDTWTPTSKKAEDNSLRDSGSSVKTHGKVKDRQAGAGVSQGVIVQTIGLNIDAGHLVRIRKLMAKAEKLYRKDANLLEIGELYEYVEVARAVDWVGRMIEKMERKS